MTKEYIKSLKPNDRFMIGEDTRVHTVVSKHRSNGQTLIISDIDVLDRPSLSPVYIVQEA